jgi:hypothetical protein
MCVYLFVYWLGTSFLFPKKSGAPTTNPIGGISRCYFYSFTSHYIPLHRATTYRGKLSLLLCPNKTNFAGWIQY